MSDVANINDTYVHSKEFVSIWLPIYIKSELPKTQTVYGQELVLKKDFHITLISLKRVAATIDSKNQHAIEDELLEHFREFVKTKDLDSFESIGEYRAVKNNGEVTIVLRVMVPGLDDLFDYIRRIYGVSVSLQPAHATLYIQPGKNGIPINSFEELEEISELIDFPLDEESKGTDS